jgi:hypothetical protein
MLVSLLQNMWNRHPVTCWPVCSSLPVDRLVSSSWSAAMSLPSGRHVMWSRHAVNYQVVIRWSAFNRTYVIVIQSADRQLIADQQADMLNMHAPDWYTVKSPNALSPNGQSPNDLSLNALSPNKTRPNWLYVRMIFVQKILPLNAKLVRMRNKSERYCSESGQLFLSKFILLSKDNGCLLYSIKNLHNFLINPMIVHHLGFCG